MEPANETNNDTNNNVNANGGNTNTSTLNQLDPVFLCGINVDPTRMEISARERQQALRIKEAIAATPELDPVSDFECVQLALVDGDDVAKALERAAHFQAFREQYNFNDSIEESLRMVNRFVQLFPDALLSLSYHELEKNYVLVMDLARMDRSLLRTLQDERAYQIATYALMAALCPDFYAIRKGCFIIIECEGYENRWNVSTRRRAWTEVLSEYPFIIRQLKYYNTGVFANLAVSLLKRFISNPIYQNIQVGCQSPLGRLDAFYALPTRDAARERFLERTALCLRTRYHHIETFRLPADPPTNGT